MAEANVTTVAEVLLTLTEREYRVLRWLVYQHLGGDFPERHALEAAFDSIDAQIPSGGPEFCERRTLLEYVEAVIV